MPLKNSWTYFIFSGFNLNYQKKRDFTLLFISLVGTTHVSSTAAASKACKITMEAMAGRIEQTARPGCTSLLTKIRKSSTSLQFRLGWKTLEKKRQNILQQQPQKQITEWAASLHQQPCEKAASKAQKTINRKKNYLRYQKTKWRHTKRNYTLCIARILYPAIIIDRNHVNFQNDRPKN